MAETPVALVTGANRGIGLEVVRQLADRGYAVVLGSRDLAKGEAAAKEFGERVQACQLDVADSASVAAMAEQVSRTYGRVDAVVNNAAILYDTWQRAVTADLAVVREAMETNLFGSWQVTQALLDPLRASAHPRVVNVSSEAGSLAAMSGGTPAYSVSKAALNALTRLLAGELKRDRILVNAICPGWVDTDMGQGGRPVAEGAAGVVWAATLPDDGPTGGFFRDRRPLRW
ncbi:SDR family oxidoreductase [Fodinicola feengrottensis]|uniref:SDR family oxidoreductase n=1 Tax=Fodinicola feengrottensis TaxID=435914 RepID=A0ABN2IW58_9ACTN|nr:SDR family oxidoreductase [Fodinicola feengrottensis]